MKRILAFILLGLIIVCPLVLAEDDILSKYTFVPGEKMLLSEDLTNTSIGEIPLLLNGNGEGETVLVGGERWLKMGKNLGLSIGIKEPVKDLTLELYLKLSNVDVCNLVLKLENEKQSYAAQFDIGANGVGWGAAYQDESLPGGSLEKEFFTANQSVQIALTYQNERVKLFVNKILAANVAGFAPVMPNKIYIISADPFEIKQKEDMVFIKDITVATVVPNIADEILNKGKYTSHGIHFDTGSAKVKDESYSVLRQVADVMTNNPDLKLMIVGHTDNVGAKDVNQKLSLNRAESVKQYLVTNFGIEAERIQTAGKGDTEPIGDNKTPAGRALNRRVEFVKSK